MNNLFVYNIGCLATPTGSTAKKGTEHGKILLRRDCCILIEDGVITDICDWNGRLPSLPDGTEAADAGGHLVTPGLIDCHTHLVFGGYRHKEFPLKLAGATYLEILESGGGIHSTVLHTRSSSYDELLEKASGFLDEYLSMGVTAVEAKSGYGLDYENEQKSLRVLNALSKSHKVDVSATFMGAHAMPKEYADDRDAYISLVCERMLPEFAEQKLAEFCDVFCEKSAFSLDESRKILETARKYGYKLRIHAEEITNLGGAQLAAELGCTSAEHLIKIDKNGIKALSASDTVAVCLPCTSFYLNEDFAPAKDIILAGGAVAVATDFNPGSSPNLNLQLVASFACYKYRLSPEEALTAITLNAASVIRREKDLGSVETGKAGDLVIWNADDLSYIFYRYGTNLVKTVIKGGTIVKNN